MPRARCAHHRVRRDARRERVLRDPREGRELRVHGPRAVTGDRARDGVPLAARRHDGVLRDVPATGRRAGEGAVAGDGVGDGHGRCAESQRRNGLEASLLVAGVKPVNGRAQGPDYPTPPLLRPHLRRGSLRGPTHHHSPPLRAHLPHGPFLRQPTLLAPPTTQAPALQPPHSPPAPHGPALTCPRMASTS